MKCLPFLYDQKEALEKMCIWLYKMQYLGVRISDWNWHGAGAEISLLRMDQLVDEAQDMQAKFPDKHPLIVWSFGDPVKTLRIWWEFFEKQWREVDKGEFYRNNTRGPCWIPGQDRGTRIDCRKGDRKLGLPAAKAWPEEGGSIVWLPKETPGESSRGKLTSSDILEAHSSLVSWHIPIVFLAYKPEYAFRMQKNREKFPFLCLPDYWVYGYDGKVWNHEKIPTCLCLTVYNNMVNLASGPDRKSLDSYAPLWGSLT